MKTIEEFIEENGIALRFKRTNEIEWIGCIVSKSRVQCRGCNTYLTFNGRVKHDNLKWAHRFKNRIACAACGAPVVDTDGGAEFVCTLTRAGYSYSIDTPFTMGNPLGEPDVCSILESLKLDASCWLNTANVDDFINELGYMSRDDAWSEPRKVIQKAEADYNACGETYKKLGDFLGSDKREELFSEVEGY
jgi:hypothetical protein